MGILVWENFMEKYEAVGNMSHHINIPENKYVHLILIAATM